MTTEVLIEKVRAKHGPLDTKTEQILVTAMNIFREIETPKARTMPKQPEDKFISENITLEEYKALPREEKRRYLDEAEEVNQRWVNNQLNRLNAKWIMVIDGQVVLHGVKLDDYPEDEDFIALCEKTGKYPFVFFSWRVFAIEERATAWHRTHELGDAYPALPIAVIGDGNRLETEADLDTGAIDFYCALSLLEAHGIVKIQPTDHERTSRHLSRPFFYFTKRVELVLSDDAGTFRTVRKIVFCVENWQTSPFTAINPARTCLIGRGVLRELRPRLTLDFEADQTMVLFRRAGS